MLIQINQNKQRKVVKHSPIIDFFLDLSKSMPYVMASKTKMGFKLQPKFIATVRWRVSFTIKRVFYQCRYTLSDNVKYLSILNQEPAFTSMSNRMIYHLDIIDLT